MNQPQMMTEYIRPVNQSQCLTEYMGTQSDRQVTLAPMKMPAKRHVKECSIFGLFSSLSVSLSYKLVIR